MISVEEHGLRRELAAAYRAIALAGWDDHVATHLSARLSDGSYLINPFGFLFGEITASSLIRVSSDGKPIDRGEYPVNPAGTNIHGGLLAGRADIGSVMHLHTRDGVAVSVLEEGLLPLSQNALNIWHDVSYHDFEGIVTAEEERTRLLADLGDRHLLILRNHGTLTVGRSIASALYRMHALEWACASQVSALSMGRALRLPSQKVIDSQGRTMGSDWIDGFAEQRFWPALRRKVDRECPGYDD